MRRSEEELLLWMHRGGLHYHTTRKCPRFRGRRGAGFAVTYDEAWAANVDPCWVCCPRTIYVVPDAPAPSVYHVKLKCRDLARAYHDHPEWLERIVWPTWEYGHVTTDRSYTRCRRCIPSREVLRLRRGRRSLRTRRAA